MKIKQGIWRYIKNYKFNSLFVKNFALILILVIMPFIGITLGIYGYYGNIVRNEISAANKRSLNTVRDITDMIIREADKMAVSTSTDIFVESFLTNKKDVFPNYDTINVLQNIDQMISIFAKDYIDSIHVYSDINDYIISSKEGGGALSRFSDIGWFDSYQANKNTPANRWIVPREHVLPDESIKHYITMLYKAPYFSNQKSGVVIVNLSIDQLNQLIGISTDSQNDAMYIVDSDGMILFSSNIASVGDRFIALTVEDYRLFDDDNSLVKEFDGDKHVFSYVDSQYNEWKYISQIPLNIYEKKIQNLKQFMWIAIITCMIISIIVTFLISVSVFKPIKDILTMIEAPEAYISSNQNGLSKKIVNEYRYIATNILKSFDENKHIKEELEERMSLLRQSNALALQAQINPHFLFNTLQTVNWLAIDLTHEENKVSQVVESLSTLLRVIMETDTPLICIQDEIGYAKQYVEIQKLRYKNKFEVQWNVQPEVLEYAIAKITLQPVIENAIYHGIKPGKEKGTICINITDTTDSIIVSVLDNGVGMDDEQIEHLNMELKTEYFKGDHHIGLKNVNQRIKLIFGEAYGVKLCKHAEKGLHIKIVIPKVKISH